MVRAVAVAEAAVGLDRLGVTRDLAQLRAQAFDMAVDGALVPCIGGHPQGVKQLFSAEHPLRLLQQRLQQAKFMAGEREVAGRDK